MLHIHQLKRHSDIQHLKNCVEINNLNISSIQNSATNTTNNNMHSKVIQTSPPSFINQQASQNLNKTAQHQLHPAQNQHSQLPMSLANTSLSFNTANANNYSNMNGNYNQNHIQATYVQSSSNVHQTLQAANSNEILIDSNNSNNSNVLVKHQNQAQIHHPNQFYTKQLTHNGMKQQQQIHIQLV